MTRRAMDFYETHPALTRAMLEHLGDRLKPGARILEPCAGNGAITRELESRGFVVVTADLDPQWETDHRGLNVLGQRAADLFGAQNFDAVITNPPFGIAPEVVRATLQWAPLVVHLLFVNWLEPTDNRTDTVALPGSALIMQRCSLTDFSGNGGDPRAPMWRVWDEATDGVSLGFVTKHELYRHAGQMDLFGE